jgi:hypothetical protein
VASVTTANDDDMRRIVTAALERVMVEVWTLRFLHLLFHVSRLCREERERESQGSVPTLNYS